MTTSDSGSPSASAKKWNRWLVRSFLLLFLLITGVLFLVGTEAGLRILVRAAVLVSDGRLAVESPAGRLIGPLQVANIRVSTEAAEVQLHELAIDWLPSKLVHRQVWVDYLTVSEVTVDGLAVDTDETPAEVPAHLQLPIKIRLDPLEIGRLTIRSQPDDTQSPETVFSLSKLRAAFESDGVTHRLQHLSVETDAGDLVTSGVLSGTSPFEVAAEATLSGVRDGQGYRLEATAAGDLKATRLIVQATEGRIEGRLAIEVAVFDSFPLHQVQLMVKDLDPSVFNTNWPEAHLQLEADLKKGEGEALEEAGLVGGVRVVNQRPMAVDKNGLPFHLFSTQLRWSSVRTHLDDIHLRFARQGTVTGQMTINTAQTETAGVSGDISRAPWISAALQLKNIDTSTIDERLPRQRVDGKVDATADTLHQTARIELKVGQARIEAQGEVHSKDSGTLPVERQYALSAHLRSVNPRAIYPNAPEGLLNLDFNGQGKLGEVFGLEADFAFRDSRLRGHALGGRGRFQIADSVLPVVDVVIDFASNHLAIKGAWGTENARLDFTADAGALDALGDAFGGKARVEGVIAGTPATPAGKVIFFADRLRLPGIHIAAANGQGRLDAGKDGVFQFVAGVSGVAGGQGEEAVIVDALRVSAEGKRGQHQIALFTQRQDDTLDIRMEGGLLTETDQLHWRGFVTRLVTEGRLPLQLQAPAALSLAKDHVELARAEFSGGERGRVMLEKTFWTPGAAAFEGQMTGMRVELQPSSPQRVNRPRSSAYADPLMLGARWDVELKKTIEGEIHIFRESGDLAIEGEIRTLLGLEQLEARLVARASQVSAALDIRGKEIGTVAGVVSMRLEPTEGGGWQIAPTAPLTGSARLEMPSIAWVGRLLEEHVETTGRLNAEMTVQGTFVSPHAAGRIIGQGLQFAWVDQGLIVSGGEMSAEFDRDRLRLVRLQFSAQNRIRPRENRIPFKALTATPGILRATGEIALVSGDGRFEILADRFPLFQQPERWLLVSGRGSIRSSWTEMNLDADIRADAGYIELADSAPPSLSDDVIIVGREPVRSSSGMVLNADMRLSLGDALFLSGLGVNTRLAGQLRLRQTAETPLVATGAIETVDGRFRGYGQNLTIVRGLVTFQGALDNPGLNIVALRTGLPVEAGVSITGSASRPQMQLVSEPPVPDPEKLSWLVLGRPPAAGGGGDLAALLPAAQALLVGVGGNVAEDLSHSLGFDSFSIGQGDTGGGGVVSGSRVAGGSAGVNSDPALGGQVLALGKRLSSDLMLSFEQSLGGAETLVRLSYQLSRRVSLVARSGTDNALDLYYSFSFR